MARRTAVHGILGSGSEAVAPPFRSVRFPALPWILCFGLVGMISSATAEESGALLARLRVEAGALERLDCPVSVALPQSLRAGDKVALFENAPEGSRPVPCQMDEENPPRLHWVLAGRTPAGSSRHFELRTATDPPAPAVIVADDGKSLDVLAGGQLALRYHHATVPPPSGASQLFARSGFIHPLCSPAGQVLTQIHPSDHFHHYGIFGPWTRTEFEGRKVDFWNVGAGQGTVRFAGLLARSAGPVYGGFQVSQEHVDLSAPQGPRVALVERLEVRVYPLSFAGAPTYLVDYVSRQRCAGASPLVLNKYRYGGFGYRARADWDNRTSRMLTSEGQTREDANTARVRWCGIAGETEAGRSAIVFLSHPANLRHPEPIRVWPPNMRPPQHFVNFCPVQEETQEDLVIEPGRDYSFRYRIWVSDRELDAELADAAWRDYAEPPNVIVER